MGQLLAHFCVVNCVVCNVIPCNFPTCSKYLKSITNVVISAFTIIDAIPNAFQSRHILVSK